MMELLNWQVYKNWLTIDFGLAKIVSDNQETTKQMTSWIGTSYYIAPEVVLGKQYDGKCDVFGYAMIIYEFMANEMNPFGKGNRHIEGKVALDPQLRPKDLSFVQYDVDLSKTKWLMTLIKRCWTHDPSNRPHFVEISDILSEHL